MNPVLTQGRILMADSLGFHIIFALLGVGLPLLVCLAELIGLARRDPDFTAMAKRWAFGMSTLFVVGAISGTVVAFELAILWPTFMAFAGKIIGLPIFMETFAFFLEAIFLGIYLFTWDRLGPMAHWLCSLPIVIGGAASAFFITTVNAFMNSPAGFTLVNGVATNIHPFSAMFNPATPTETTHSIFSYYLTTVLLLAGLYAFKILRSKKNDEVNKNESNKKNSDAGASYRKKAVAFTLILACVFSILVGVTGDSSGKFLARYEPLKLATAEGLQTTESHAPLVVFGVRIPDMLSFLAFGSVNANVKGLDAFSPDLWPPSWIHQMFDIMAVSGIILVIVPFLFLALWLWRRRLAFSKAMLWAIVPSGLLALVAVECGWILTEVGRQPYIITGIMTTEQAFTTSAGVADLAVIFPILYLALFIITAFILVKHYRRPRSEINRTDNKVGSGAGNSVGY
jgi:cytochrome d ubiquinol oxidase subunit I